MVVAGALEARSYRFAIDVCTDWMTWVVKRRRLGLVDHGHQVPEQEVPQVEQVPMGVS